MFTGKHLLAFYCLLVWMLSFCRMHYLPSNNNDDDTAFCPALDVQARQFLVQANEKLRQAKHEEYTATYNFNTNVTQANRKIMNDLSKRKARISKELAQQIKESNFDTIKDPLIKRQLNYLSELGTDALDDDDFTELQNAISDMTSHYATATVCNYTNQNDCSLTLEPHIQERLSNSRDANELAWYWQQWHDKAGTPMRANFAKYVHLTRKAAHLNNYRSYADYWLHFYEDSDIEENFDATFKAILPLYRELHAYVRNRLHEYYGAAIVPKSGNIPIHVLGNMWAQTWEDIIDLIIPYPDEPDLDITNEMKKQDYTVRKLFELGDEFFQSLGMRALPESFWNLSMLTRPNDRQVLCHASAWDFYQNSDVRIKMCTELNTHYLYVVHHELGHIQYYLQYEKQPTVFRDTPNPGFHEAVGDLIALSVDTPKHLKRLGLTQIGHLDERSRINKLFKTALKKVAFLPFGYTLDKFRYAVFRDNIDETQWNCNFWKMRSEFSGIEPPVNRTDHNFDPTAKMHVSADVEYLRYFAAHIFQFQFLKAMCQKAGEYDVNNPDLALDNCDFFGSREAGKAFQDFLSVGASRHWKEIFNNFTGETKMNATAFLEYFAPLYTWLQKENERTKTPVGWEETKKIPENCLAGNTI